MSMYRPFTKWETDEIKAALSGLNMSTMDLIAELGERVDGEPYADPDDLPPVSELLARAGLSPSFLEDDDDLEDMLEGSV